MPPVWRTEPHHTYVSDSDRDLLSKALSEIDLLQCRLWNEAVNRVTVKLGEAPEADLAGYGNWWLRVVEAEAEADEEYDQLRALEQYGTDFMEAQLPACAVKHRAVVQTILGQLKETKPGRAKPVKSGAPQRAVPKAQPETKAVKL